MTFEPEPVVTEAAGLMRGEDGRVQKSRLSSLFITLPLHGYYLCLGYRTIFEQIEVVGQITTTLVNVFLDSLLSFFNNASSLPRDASPGRHFSS